jgi:predicted acetyltransferase
MIRKLSAGEFTPLADMLANAFPGMHVSTAEERVRLSQRLFDTDQTDRTSTWYGLFRNGAMHGGMRLLDFNMNFAGIMVPAGGVGAVAVDLLHKKERVAKEMMDFFLRHYRARGACFALLYPFRPDFYKQMGFGHGTKKNRYIIGPAALPSGSSKAHIKFLNAPDRQAILDCYTRFTRRTHGMIDRSDAEHNTFMQTSGLHIVGYRVGETVRGYLAFTFEIGENFVTNDLHVRELVYEDREALSELLTFLHTQADQIRHIIFDTQGDEFHLLLNDPRNGSLTFIPHVFHESNVQAVGLMYRVIDVPSVFRTLQGHNFGRQSCAVRFDITDTFLPENSGSVLVCFEEGEPAVKNDGQPDVTVQIGIAEFSSLIMGTARFSNLYHYNLAEISDRMYLDKLDRLFAQRSKPVCTTRF